MKLFFIFYLLNISFQNKLNLFSSDFSKTILSVQCCQQYIHTPILPLYDKNCLTYVYFNKNIWDNLKHYKKTW